MCINGVLLPQPRPAPRHVYSGAPVCQPRFHVRQRRRPVCSSQTLAVTLLPSTTLNAERISYIVVAVMCRCRRRSKSPALIGENDAVPVTAPDLRASTPRYSCYCAAVHVNHGNELQSTRDYYTFTIYTTCSHAYQLQKYLLIHT